MRNLTYFICFWDAPSLPLSVQTCYVIWSLLLSRRFFTHFIFKYQDEDDTNEEDDNLEEEELELRKAIRQSLSEIVASSSVNGNPNDALQNLDEIEVISEEDIDDLRGEV